MKSAPLLTVHYQASCDACGKQLTVQLGKKAAAVTVLRALTVEHKKNSPACTSGFLILPMLSHLR